MLEFDVGVVAEVELGFVALDGDFATDDGAAQEDVADAGVGSYDAVLDDGVLDVGALAERDIRAMIARWSLQEGGM